MAWWLGWWQRGPWWSPHAHLHACGQGKGWAGQMASLGMVLGQVPAEPLRKPDLSRTMMLHAASCSLFFSFINLLLLSFAMSPVDQAAKTCLEKSTFRPSPQPAQAFAQATLHISRLFDLPVACCQDTPGQALGHALHLQEPRGFHLSHTFRGEMSSLLCFCFLDDRLPRRTLRSTLRPLAVPALRTWCSTGSRPWQQHSVRGSSPSKMSASQSWAQAHPSCCWMTMMWSHTCRWVLPCGWALAGRSMLSC